jgi:hypothetical protein
MLAHLQAAYVHSEQRSWAACEREARKALQRDPHNGTGLLLLGVALREQGRLDDAEQCFLELLARNPGEVRAHNNLGVIDNERGNCLDAVEHFQSAIRCDNECMEAHHHLGMVLVRLGQFRKGLEEIEWRLHPQRQAGQWPLWDGAPLDGTLVVRTEQGLGDTLQFARFLPAIRARCRRVILLCPAPLECLFGGDGWADEMRRPGRMDRREFDSVMSLLSAPFLLGTELESIPRQIPYLVPAMRDVTLPPHPLARRRWRVGIAWAGSPTHHNDRHRSCRLHSWAPLWELSDVAWYSLQIGPAAEQLASDPAASRVVCDLSGYQGDLADTAALMQQLDMILTVDTSLLHLAGALGLPVWGLMSHCCDWRWMLDREDSPWYPTLRLCRQKSLDDWSELFARVANELPSALARQDSGNAPTRSG